MGVDHAQTVRAQTRHRRFEHVGDAANAHTLRLHLAQSSECIRCFSALRNTDNQVALPHQVATVAILMGVFDANRNAGDVFDEITSNQRRVPRGSAGLRNLVARGAGWT